MAGCSDVIRKLLVHALSEIKHSFSFLDETFLVKQGIDWGGKILINSSLCFLKGILKSLIQQLLSGHNTYVKFSCGALGIAMG